MRKFSILTLDDDINFNNLLLAKMPADQFNISSYTNVKDFLFNLGLQSWDCCFIDLNLTEGPDIGFSVIKILRSEKFNIKIPLFVLSRDSEHSKIAHALEIGATDYISKPIDIDIILSKIKYTLESASEIETLDPSLVPSEYRAAEIHLNLIPEKINEEGINLIAPYFISKGTYVELKGDLISEIFHQSTIKLLVTKNARITDNSYMLYVEYTDENPELSILARKWIIDQKS